MKVLITGGKGQLGKDLESVFLSTGIHQVISLGHGEMDITKPALVHKLIGENRPDVVIHAAANTNVDGCELKPDKAYLVNALGSRNVAVAASNVEAKLVYVSTDYVFDGRSDKPYSEFDRANPINIYGKSKLAGEQYVTGQNNKYFIIRTSWLYGQHGHNFAKTILRLAAEKAELTVADDQIGSPTYTKDLAMFIADLTQTDLYGIYHASNRGSCSWFLFARTILTMAGLNNVKARPISTSELNRPAPRPAYSVLDNYCMRLEGFQELRPWEEALKEYLANSKVIE